MKQLFQNLLIRLSGNTQIQRLLERIVTRSQYLMGIGSGAGVYISGEKVLVQKLKQQYTQKGQPLFVFDVGSNKGQFLSLIESGLQGIPFYIHAFEPSHCTFDILSENAKNYSNVQLNNFGLGKESGLLELFYDKNGSSLASLSKRRLAHFGIDFSLSEQVRIETLDNYCCNQKVQCIDLLKLDVEGHELDVLNGGIKMLQDKKIRMVSFEFGGCNIDTRTYFQDFWYFFKENGMSSIYRIAPSGSLIRLKKYKEAHEQFRTTNFLVLFE